MTRRLHFAKKKCGHIGEATHCLECRPTLKLGDRVEANGRPGTIREFSEDRRWVKVLFDGETEPVVYGREELRKVEP